ncbi:hypothetical protein J1N35_011363 [Gossypium stocksii]|uniref:Zinc knuckle CX2CX4HX4C domain-containing protein n=1 Tax=Gossypium stocksii TaxID=47602 RepID=A0A9D4ADC7_9ROSI|nr:hypothetical protein J1N35_011363 [Gossypium stocksii]
MDMERVLKGSPWTFNNQLLMLYKLQRGEDPMRVPLIFSPFWVQIQDIPFGFFSERLAVQLGNFIGGFVEYDGPILGKENRKFMRIRVQVDVRRPLTRKKQLMFNGRCFYVRFKYELLSLFCFYYGRLGHSDSFCKTKMALGVEVAEVGWDLSLRAQSCRALAMKSVWLCEEREDGWSENQRGCQELGNRVEVNGKKGDIWGTFDPILGINLEGNMHNYHHDRENSGMKGHSSVMDEDREDSVLVGQEGKKRQRGDIDNLTGREEDNSMVTENIFTHEIAKEALEKNEGYYLEGDISEQVRRVLERIIPRAPD